MISNKSSNPVFKSIAKDRVIATDAASFAGISFKTILLITIAIIMAVVSVYFGTNLTTVKTDGTFVIDNWLYIILGVSFFTSFLSVMLATFFPRVAMPFSILYSLGEGAFLGVITAIVNIFIPGAAVVALLGVGTIFVVMLTLYSIRAIRVTSKFRKMMLGIMISLILVSLFSVIFSLFMPNFLVGNNIYIAIGITVFLIIFGAFMLMLDFDYAEQIVNAGFDKRYEWVAALGFMVTLVWIYVQILRLLILIAAARD